MFKAVTLLTVASMVAIAPATPSYAKINHVSRNVSYADLDLSTPAGQRSLHNRIAYAVRQICGDNSGVYSSFDLSMLSKCKREAWSSSRQQVADAVTRATGQAGTKLATR